MRPVAWLCLAAMMPVVLVSCKSTPGTAPAPKESGGMGLSVAPSERPAVPPKGPARVEVPPARPAQPVHPQLVGGVMAVVNSDIVTKEEVLDDLRPAFAKLDADPSLTDEGRKVK